MSSSSTSFHLDGLTETPIFLNRNQLGGDVNLLLAHPNEVDLVVSHSMRKTSTAQRKRKQQNTEPGSLTDTSWRPFQNIKHYPDPALQSLTIFNGEIYDTMQHAFLSCLFWCYGGMNDSIKYSSYPCKKTGNIFPHMVVHNPSALGLHVDDELAEDQSNDLAVHLVTCMPTQKQLLQFGNWTAEFKFKNCMLLVGTLIPRKLDPFNDPPQLNGILIRGSGFLSGSKTFSSDAVTYGYQPCVCPVSDPPKSMVFALHAQMNGVALQPLLLPALSSFGLKLYKRGDSKYAVAHKGANDENFCAWNEMLIKPTTTVHVGVSEEEQKTKSPEAKCRKKE